LVLQSLQRQPVTSAAALVKATGLALATVNRMLMQLMDVGIVSELTQRQRDRIFSYRAYVDALNAEL
jgi:DNA-binding IclR family transcriptional regulator